SRLAIRSLSRRRCGSPSRPFIVKVSVEDVAELVRHREHHVVVVEVSVVFLRVRVGVFGTHGPPRGELVGDTGAVVQRGLAESVRVIYPLDVRRTEFSVQVPLGFEPGAGREVRAVDVAAELRGTAVGRVVTGPCVVIEKTIRTDQQAVTDIPSIAKLGAA